MKTKEIEKTFCENPPALFYEKKSKSLYTVPLLVKKYKMYCKLIKFYKI